jgi:hypothetical protein
MKSLKKYIAESVHLYEYTIKIAGEIDKNFLDLFKYNLKKFDPVEIGEPVTTPIQKNPYGFPNLQNVPVTVLKCKFRYPATEPMVQQLAQLLGYNLNYVRLVSTSFNDSINVENSSYEEQMKDSPLLNVEQMGSAPGAKEANTNYGDSYLSSIKDQAKNSKLDIEYSAKKTSTVFDPFKPETYVDKKGQVSPMSKITRPAKPKTGAMAG